MKKSKNKLNMGGGVMVAEGAEDRGRKPEAGETAAGPSLKQRIQAAPEVRAPWASIQRSATNPRKTFNLEDLEDAKELGIISALWVRPLLQFTLHEPDLTSDEFRVVGPDGVPDSFPKAMENVARMVLEEKNRFQYELIAGERRHRKAEELNIDVPVKVIDCTPDEAWKLQRIENLKRQDITPLEEAQDFRLSVDSGKWGSTVDASVKAIAEDLKCSWQHIYDRMALLKLSDTARQAFIDGQVDICLAKEISAVPDEKAQKKLLERHEEFPFTVRSIRDTIEEEHMRVLDGATFDLKAETLVTIARDCGSCPKRTGNMLGAFPHLKTKPNYCTDPKCFALKAAAERELKLESYRAKGFRVLTAKESKPLFENWNPSLPARRKGWALANTVATEDKQERTLKQLGKLVDLKPAVCCDGNGAVVELFEVEPLKKALLEKKILKPSKQNEGARSGALSMGHTEKVETDAERVARLMEREVARQLERRVVGALVAVVEKKADKKLPDVLRAMACAEHREATADAIWHRRGWPGDHDLTEFLRAMSAPELLGLLFETTLLGYRDYQVQQVADACREWGVDAVKLEKEIRAEVKEQFKHMGALSAELLKLCTDRGMDNGAAQKFVAEVAKEKSLRQWADTQCPADYRALIQAVREKLGPEAEVARDEAKGTKKGKVKK